mgnify:CR=1 FL=1|tara:strand:- start:9179 stop:10069 length:891 start_codon:yes stop_codon:yes gene_type:complete
MSEDILTSYSGVTLTPDEVASLTIDENSPMEQVGEEQTQEPEVQKTDQSEQVETVQTEGQEESVKIDSLELNGETYEMSTIQEALDALKNKEDWQKSNTEKSQSISEERKALEAEQSKWNGLRDNEDAIEALKDVLDEDHPIFSKGKAEELPNQDTKDVDRIQELEDRLSEYEKGQEQKQLEVEADQQVTADLMKLKQNHPELEDENLMDEVITTAIDKGFNGLQGLEDAFVLAYHSAAEDSAFKTAVNRVRNAKAMKSVPEPEGAVKGQHEEPVRKPNSYKDARNDALKNYNFFE